MPSYAAIFAAYTLPSRVGLRAPLPGDFDYAVVASFPPGASSATLPNTYDALSAGSSASSSPDGDSNDLDDDEAPKSGVVQSESRLIASVGRFTRRSGCRYHHVGRCLVQESLDNSHHSRQRQSPTSSTPRHGEYTEAPTWNMKASVMLKADKEDPIASLELSRQYEELLGTVNPRMYYRP